MPTSHKSQVFCKQGFRDTKAIFCLLGKLPNPHRTLPAASGCASVPDASTAVPAKEKSPVQHEHYTHTAPDIPSSTALSIFFFLPHFLLMQLLFFCSSSFRFSCIIFCATSQSCISDLVLRYSACVRPSTAKLDFMD